MDKREDEVSGLEQLSTLTTLLNQQPSWVSHPYFWLQGTGLSADRFLSTSCNLEDKVFWCRLSGPGQS